MYNSYVVSNLEVATDWSLRRPLRAQSDWPTKGCKQNGINENLARAFLHTASTRLRLSQNYEILPHARALWRFNGAGLKSRCRSARKGKAQTADRYGWQEPASPSSFLLSSHCRNMSLAPSFHLALPGALAVRGLLLLLLYSGQWSGARQTRRADKSPYHLTQSREHYLSSPFSSSVSRQSSPATLVYLSLPLPGHINSAAPNKE